MGNGTIYFPLYSTEEVEEASSLFKEGVSSLQREALFDTKKRPSRMEKGVPFFSLLRFLLTRHSLATLKLYYTGIPAKPYIKQN